MVALLGILVALNSVLRYLEVAIPGPGGFSPIFFLIILCGYCFGAKFGFLMGAMTLFVSAILTGGVGPWLPSQMFTAGWVGMSAPLLAPLVSQLGWQGKHGETIVLATFGAIWGVLYGAIMNLWSWPFLIGSPDQYWQPGISLGETLARYGVFYLVTSLAWDMGRSFGNVLLIVAMAPATLRVLRRFRERFTFVYIPPEG
jgi:energy-coupling factor transport system substrate-specific component